MCVYSAFVTEAKKQWPGMMPNWSPPPSWPWEPNLPGVAGAPPPSDPRILQEILDIGRRLDKIDKALGLKDCTQEAASKKAFEDRLTKLIEDAKQLKSSVECKNDAQCGTSSGSISVTAQGLVGGITSGYIQATGSAGQSMGDRKSG